MEHDKRVLIFEPIPTDAEFIDLQIRKSGIPQTLKRIATRDMFEKTVAEFAPDLIVADYSIPRCDVLALLRHHRAENPSVRWVIVAGAGTEDLAVECMKAGASDYLAKKNITRLGPIVKAIFDTPVSAPALDVVSPPPAGSLEEEEPPDMAGDLFRRIVETSHDLIAVTDLDGKRLYNSPSYRDLLEEPDTLEGTSSFLDVHPDDRDKVKRTFQQTVATGIGSRLEYRLIDREGNVRYIESQGSVILDSEGHAEKIVIFSRDITRRRETGEVIRLIQEEIARLRGDEFFSGLVRVLAAELGVKYALVSECVDRRRERVRALAYWAAGGFAPLFEYDVKNTTCEQVLQSGQTMYFSANVQEMFPDEVALGAMHAYAYLGTPLLDSTATPIGHLFIIHDQALPNDEQAAAVLTVTAARASAELEHRLTVRRLTDGQAQYRSLLEEMANGVIVTDMEDVITYVNGRMSELTGYEEGEMVGKLASTLLVPDEERRDLYARNERRRRGMSESYTATLKRKDSSLFDARLSASPHRNQAGEVVGTLAIVSPADPKEAPVAAPAGGEETGLLEKAQDAVFVCDLDDTILFWNPAAALLYGWSADEARGKTSADLLHTENIHRLGGAAHTALIEGYWAGELRQRKKDGDTVLVDSRWTLVRDAGGRPRSMLIISTDITGSKALEIYELRARRMEGIATLASAIAADLDAMLTPVMLAVPALSRKADDDPSRQALALITGNAQRGLEFADQIVALAEVAGGRQGLLDPVDILAGAVNGLAGSLPASITLESALSRSLWPIPGIMTQIQQVLANVCTNAREAMSDGGVLRLAAENLLLDAQSAASQLEARPGRYVLITVGDTGRGIPQENIDKVFEPFFTTKPAGRTTGLGLSTAAAIVRNHKGIMNIYSEPGKGTIVKIYLPAGERDEGENETDVRLGHGERILIVQQQASLRDVLRKILEVHGYEAVAVADGAEAVAFYGKYQAEIGAVIIDLDMPYMDGSTTIRLLQRTNPAVKIITTGGTSGESIDSSSALPKPFTAASLLKELHRVVLV